MEVRITKRSLTTFHAEIGKHIVDEEYGIDTYEYEEDKSVVVHFKKNNSEGKQWVIIARDKEMKEIFKNLWTNFSIEVGSKEESVEKIKEAFIAREEMRNALKTEEVEGTEELVETEEVVETEEKTEE